MHVQWRLLASGAMLWIAQGCVASHNQHHLTCSQLNRSNPSACADQNVGHLDKPHAYRPPTYAKKTVGFAKPERVIAANDYEVEFVESKPEPVPTPQPAKAAPSKWNQSVTETFSQLETEAKNAITGTKAHITPVQHAVKPRVEKTVISMPAPELPQRAAVVAAEPEKSKVILFVNQNRKIQLPNGIKHVFVTNPEMVATQRQADNSLTLTAKKTGDTELFLMSQEERIAAKYQVTVQYDLERIRQAIRPIASGVDVRYNPVQQEIILAGSVDSEKISLDIKNAVRRVAGEDQKVMNQISVIPPEKKGVRVSVTQDGRHIILNNITPAHLKRMLKQSPWLAELPVL